MRLGRAFLFPLSLIVLAMLCSCGNSAPNVASVTVSAPSSTIASGQSVQLTVTITYSGSSTQSNPTVTYASSNTAVATVDASGKVTGKSQGTAIITATTQGTSGTFGITVGPPGLGSFSFSSTNFSLGSGQNSVLQLSGTLTDGTAATASSFAACTWTSSNLDAVTLSASAGASNTLQGKATGSSTISVTCGTLTPVTTTVTVTAPVIASVAVTPANPSVSVGATQQFTATATMTDNTTQDVTSRVIWSSSDTTKATITTGGLATGTVAGYTTIKATPSVGTAGSTLLTVVSLSPNIALVYPLDSSDSRLAEATVGSDGTLVAVLGSPLNGISGVTVAAHPNGTNLYLGNNTATITGYTSSVVNISVDKSTGKLTFPSYSDAPAGFVYSLVGNPNGKFLHGIEKNSASSILLETLTLDSTTGRPSGAAHTVYVLNNTYSGSIRTAFNSSGSIMYVSGQDYVPGNVPPLGTPRLYVFQVDATTGALTLLQNVALSLVVNGGMSLDSTGKYLLAGVQDPNTSAASIQVFSIDGSGQLSPASTYRTYNASDIAIHGANGYVFAGRVGLDSGGNTALAVFTLDGTGNLVQVTTISIPATVNDMQVSNDGAYVTVLLNNQLSTYGFDSMAGTLMLVNSVATGGGSFNQMAYIPLK